jgi:hypothetical protein
MTDLASGSPDLFNFLDQLVFRLFVLGSLILTAGLLLRPKWQAFRGHGQKRSARKRRTAKRPRTG